MISSNDLVDNNCSFLDKYILEPLFLQKFSQNMTFLGINSNCNSNFNMT